MKTVLYAWEIGDGFGHIRNLAAVARALPDHRAAFAVPDDQSGARRYLHAEGFDEVYAFKRPAPITLTRWLPPFAEYRAASFLDVLTCYAYDSPGRFRSLHGQVVGVLDALRPDVVVAESAPTFLLAAQGRARTLATGTSYGTPQTVTETASRYPQLDDRPLTSLLDEGDLKEVLAQALGRSRDVFEWFTADAIVPMCYPELDLYEGERDSQSVGVGPVAQMDPLPITEGSQFAYLSARHPNIRRILESLRATGAPTRAYVKGADFSSESRGSLILVDKFDLAEEMAQCARVVHHGSAGIMQAAMGAGRAQFVFPYHAENTQNCAKMWRLGNVNGCGYMEHYRYHEALGQGYDLELTNARAIADTLALRKSSGVTAVAARISQLMEARRG